MFDNNNVIINIKVNINNLTKSEKAIAEYVIRNSWQIPQMTIQELANASSVSKPTVSRFVKNIGFSSYRSFCNELMINSNNQTPEALIYNDISDFDSTENICNKVFENNVKAINETLSILDVNTLNTILQCICDAKTIHIFAQGRSSIVAEAFINRFYRLGLKCISYSDPHTEAVVSTISNKDDLIIGISTFGRSRSVVDGIKRASKNGTPTVAITGFSNTMMERYANHTLKVVASQTKTNSFEPSCETTAMITLIDCLYMMYIVKHEDEVKYMFERSNIAIEGEKVK